MLRQQARAALALSLTMAAGAVSLGLLNREVFADLEQKAERVDKELGDVFQKAGWPVQIQRVGSMLSFFFAESPVTNLAEALASDRGRYAELFHYLLKRAVYLPPAPLEAFFLSTAHTEEQIDRTVAAFRDSISEIQEINHD